MFNNTTSNNGTSRSYDFDWRAFIVSLYALYGVIIILGTLANSWMLAALVTSPELRSSMRNRLICLILFNNSIRVSFISIFEILQIALAIEHGVYIPCSFGSFLNVMRFSLMWVENWYVLILMVHYVSTLLELDPVKYLSQRNLQIGTVLILAGPWVLSFIVGPSVLAHQFHLKYGYHSEGCVYWTTSSYKALANFGIVAPWFIKMFLIVVILVLNYRRRHQYTTMNAALVGPSTHIDDVKAYVILYVIVAATQVFFVARFLIPFRLSNFKGGLIYAYFASYMIEFRCVLMPSAFLFLEDIRTRMKTWRPWYRPAPGIDLTMHYNNQTKEENAT